MFGNSGYLRCLFLSAFIGLALSADYVINDGRWNMNTVVSTDFNHLVVKITAETTGYVGFAVSFNGSYFGADLIIGGYNNVTGEGYIGDYHGTSIPPAYDAQQNVTLISASENATHTTLEFSRPIFSTDFAQDLSVENRVQPILWAIGLDDDVDAWHGIDNRGDFSLNLMSS